MSFAGHVVERCPSCGVEHDVSEAGAFAGVLGWGKTGLIAGAGLGILTDVFYLIGKLSGNAK